MSVYFNENDPYAAQWLRNLIAAGHLPAGHVDERSIVDVKPEDLAGYTQCHFFAGIGGWPLALRMAGWPDDRPVWTGSCPCQPFSGAGRQQGEKDKRHLWPEFLRLIVEWDVPTIFGEQVASALGREWLVGVSADLEDLDYVVGAADLCAAGVGAPHIRQRLYWVADAHQGQRGRLADGQERQRDGAQTGRQQGHGIAAASGVAGWMAHSARDGWREERALAGGLAAGDRAQGRPAGSLSGGAPDRLADAGRTGDECGGRSGEASGAAGAPEREARERQRGGSDAGHGGEPDRLADAQRHTGRPGRPADQSREGARAAAAGSSDESGRRGMPDRLADADGGFARHRHLQSGGQHREQPQDGVADHGRTVGRLGDTQQSRLEGHIGHGDRRDEPGRQPAQANGSIAKTSWSDCYVIPCSDGKARRSGSGVQPLAHGVPNRVGRLRAYGNAIVPQVAVEFIEAYLDVVA